MGNGENVAGADVPDLYLVGVPGASPGRYLMSTVRWDGISGPDVVVTVAADLTEQWEVV